MEHSLSLNECLWKYQYFHNKFDEEIWFDLQSDMPSVEEIRADLFTEWTTVKSDEKCYFCTGTNTPLICNVILNINFCPSCFDIYFDNEYGSGQKLMNLVTEYYETELWLTIDDFKKFNQFKYQGILICGGDNCQKDLLYLNTENIHVSIQGIFICNTCLHDKKVRIAILRAHREIQNKFWDYYYRCSYEEGYNPFLEEDDRNQIEQLFKSMHSLSLKLE